MKILVADDDALIRRIVTLSLTKAGGHEVTCVADGTHAVASAAAVSPDAILMDLNMPEMNGLEALARLKQSEDTRHIPVVMLSAATENVDLDEALALGAAGWIAKPFDPGALSAKLAAILAGVLGHDTHR